MWSRRQRLSPCVTLSVLLSLWMDLISGEINIQLIPQDPVVGGSVTLNVMGLTGKIMSFSWFKGPNTNPEYQILTYFPASTSPVTPGPLNFSRASPFPDASLQISDLRITDSGNYSVKTQTGTAAGQANVNLTVCAESPHPPGLGMGAIIGIVAGVLLVAVLGSSSYYLFVIRKLHKKASSNKNSAMDVLSRNGQTNPTTMEHSELHYADIQFGKNTQREQKPPSGSDENARHPDQTPPENIVYSDLRLH